MISAYHEYIDDEDTDKDSDSDVAGQFNLVVKYTPPEAQLAALARQLNSPDLTTDKLQEILDKLIKLDNNDQVSPDLKEKILNLFSDTLDKVDLTKDYSLLNEFKQKIRNQGYMVDNQAAEKLQELEAANDPDYRPKWGGTGMNLG